MRRWLKLGAAGGSVVTLTTLAIVGASVGAAVIVAGSLGAGLGLWAGNEKAKVDIGERGRLARNRDCFCATSGALWQMIGVNKRLQAQNEESLKSSEQVMESAEKLEQVRVLAEQRKAARILEKHHYTVKLWKLEFSRWINCLLPVIEGLDRLDAYDQACRRSEFIVKLKQAGKAMIAALIDHPASKIAAGEEFLAFFQAALDGVTTLSDEIAMRRFVIADRGASNIRPAQPLSAMLQSELERFESLCSDISAGVFDTSLGEITDEYRRLRAEAEVD